MKNDRFVGEEVNRNEKKLERLVHGGDWAGFEERFGYEPLDFSVNVSPLGLTEGIKQQLSRRLKRQTDIPIRFAEGFARRLLSLSMSKREAAFAEMGQMT